MDTLNKEQFRFTKNLFKEIKIKSKPITYQLARNEQANLSKSSGFSKRFLHTFDGNIYVSEDAGKNHTYIFNAVPSKKEQKNAILSQDIGQFSSTWLGTEQIYVEGIYDSEKKIFTGMVKQYIVEFNQDDNTLFVGEDNYNGTYTGLLLKTRGPALSNIGIIATRESGGNISMYVPPAPEHKKAGFFNNIAKRLTTFFQSKPENRAEFVGSAKESTFQITYDANSKQTMVKPISRNSSIVEDTKVSIQNLIFTEESSKISKQPSPNPSATIPIPSATTPPIPFAAVKTASLPGDTVIANPELKTMSGISLQ